MIQKLLFLLAILLATWQLREITRSCKPVNFSVITHTQIWSHSVFRSPSSLVHDAHGSYFMLTNYWHNHILWVVADNREQPIRKWSRLDSPFPAPPALSGHKHSYTGPYPDNQMQRPAFHTPCYQPTLTHAGTQGTQRVAVPKGTRSKVPADIQSGGD